MDDISLLGGRSFGEGEKFRATSAAATNGGGGGAGAGRGTSSSRRSRHWRGQIARLSRSGRSICTRSAEKGDHLDAHHQSTGAACLQGHSDLAKTSAGDL